MAGAVGTLALATAALMNMIKCPPKIVLQEGASGEYLSISTDIPQTGPANESSVMVNSTNLRVSYKYYIYRLKLTNSKTIFRSYAKHVQFRFISVESMERDKWKPLEPFNMRWTPEKTLQSAFYNDLANEESIYVNFFTVVLTSKVMRDEFECAKIMLGHVGIKSSALAAGFSEADMKKERKFRFTVGIYVENVKAKEYKYEV